jgi:hypothetical protein
MIQVNRSMYSRFEAKIITKKERPKTHEKLCKDTQNYLRIPKIYQYTGVPFENQNYCHFRRNRKSEKICGKAKCGICASIITVPGFVVIT